MQQWRAGDLEPIEQKTSPFTLRCIELFNTLRDQQQQRVETYAIGYDTDEQRFYSEVEPRVTLREVIEQVSREWQAEKALER